MTDKRKPETPGMSEVSAKFADEAETATAAPPSSASVTDDPLVALGHQWKEVYGKWVEADVYPDTSDRGAIRKYEKERTVLLLAISQLEDQAAEVAAQTVDGVLVQLRMAGTHCHLMERDGEQWANTYAKLTWQAWDGLERLVGGETSTDEALSALWQEWQRLWEANKKAVEEAQDDKLASEIFATLMTVEKRMEGMPARTVAGALLKLRVVGVWVNNEPDGNFEDEIGAMWRLTLSALADLERLADTTAPQDGVLVTLADDWYTAHKVFSAAAIANDRAREKDPEKRAAMERAEQRTDALYEQIVDTPAQGLHGIHAKMRAAVFPDQWEAVRAGKLENLGAEINSEMFFSLVADVERMSRVDATRPGAPAVATETGVTRLAALWGEYEGALDALCDATEAEEDGRGIHSANVVTEPEQEALAMKESAATARENEAWKAFLEAPCQTMAEVLFKLHTVHEQLKEHAFAFRVEDLFKAAMRDYERLSGKAMPSLEEVYAQFLPKKDAAVPDVATTAAVPLVQGKRNDLERAVSNLEGASNALNNFAQTDDLPTEVDIGLQWLAYQIDAGMVDLRDQCDKLHLAEEAQRAISGGQEA